MPSSRAKKTFPLSKTLFFIGTLVAVFSPTLWVSQFKGKTQFSCSFMDDSFWHAHEMLFVFPLCIFLAMTKHKHKDPFTGFLIVLLLMGEQLLFFLPLEKSIAFISFFPLTIIIVLTSIILFPKKANYSHYLYLACSLFLKFVFLWQAIYENSPVSIYQLELGMTCVVLAFLTQEIFPQKYDRPLSSFLLIILGLLCFQVPGPLGVIICLSFFVMMLILTLSASSLLTHKRDKKVLYLTYLWPSISLLILSYGHLTGSEQFLNALHCILAGGLSSYIARQHTPLNRPASFSSILILLLIFIGTFLRVVIPFFSPELLSPLLHHASGYWALGMIFLLLSTFSVKVQTLTSKHLKSTTSP